MPKQVTVTAYTFDELSETAKRKAREWWRESLDMFYLSDATTCDAEQVGLELPEWRLDGQPTCVVRFKEGPAKSARLILQHHGAECDTAFAAAEYLKEEGEVVAMEDAGDTDGAAEKLEEAKRVFIKALEASYADMLKKEYEYGYSDEAADDGIRANEYLFTEDGRRTHIL